MISRRADHHFAPLHLFSCAASSSLVGSREVPAGCARRGSFGSERHLVVQIVEATGQRRLLCGGSWAALALGRIASLGRGREKLDRVGEDLDAVLGDTVGAGPARVVQATLDRDLRALADVLGDVGAEAIEAGDAVPLGLLLDLAGILVGPLGRGGDRERGDVAAGLGVAADRVGAGVADDNDEVGHDGSPELRRGTVPSTGSVKSRAVAVPAPSAKTRGKPRLQGLGAGSLSRGPAERGEPERTGNTALPSGLLGYRRAA